MWSEYFRRISRSLKPASSSSSSGRRWSTTSVPRDSLVTVSTVLALATAFPAHAVLGCQTCAPRRQCHAVGDDERGVEADAELSDEMCVFGFIGGEL